MKKLQKTCEAEAEAETCLINTLPDKVLSVILSSLTLKEAGRTSVLSRRWRYLWRFTSGPNVVFEFQQKNMDGFSKWNQLGFSKSDQLGFCKWNQLVAEFVNSVNRVMILHRGTSVEKLIIRSSSLFSIRFLDLWYPFKGLNNPVGEWIRFAMHKQVRVLESVSFGDNVPCPPLFDWQQQVQPLRDANFQTFEHFDFPDLFKLYSISRFMDPKKSNLVSLQSVRLVNIKIKDEMIEHLLSICPCLEQLYVKGAQYPSNLNVVSSSLKSLSFCNCWNLKILKISAVNLVSFEYMGKYTPAVEFCFENVPHLSELIMNRSYMQSFIFQKHLHAIYYNQLEKLVLDLPSQVCVPYSPISTYRNLPRLQCLKQLELVIAIRPGESLLFYVFWAMVCPSLSTFSIQFQEEYEKLLASGNFGEYRQPKNVKKLLNSYHHKHLKLVKLTNFAGHPNYIEFALNLLQVAKSLEMLIVKPENDLERVAIIENHVVHLEANLPVGAELEIN